MGRRRKNFTENEKQRIHQAIVVEGKAIRTVAALLGCSDYVLQSYCRRHAIVTYRRKPRVLERVFVKEHTQTERPCIRCRKIFLSWNVKKNHFCPVCDQYRTRNSDVEFSDRLTALR